MRLRNEGVIQPAPALRGKAQEVSLEVQSWDGMQAVTHWQLGNSEKVDGAEFHVNDKELGHIHLNGELHLLLTKRLSRALIQNGLAEKFPWGAEWVQAPVSTESERKRALWLFRLGYDHLRAVDEEVLLERVSVAVS